MRASLRRWLTGLVLAAIPAVGWSEEVVAAPSAPKVAAPASSPSTPAQIAPAKRLPLAVRPGVNPLAPRRAARPNDVAAALGKLEAADAARLGPILEQNPGGAANLLRDHGDHVARVVRAAPLHSFDQFETDVQRQAKRISTPIAGLYDSIPAIPIPNGWKSIEPASTKRGKPIWTKRSYEGPRLRGGNRIHVDEKYRVDEDGTRHVVSDLSVPDRAAGSFETSYAPYTPSGGVVKYSSTFLGELGSWVENPVPLRADAGPDSGVPTSMSAGLNQLRVLGVPFGKPGAKGVVREVIISRIYNFETIVHLHWLKKQYPNESLENLLKETDSVTYTDSQLRQAGYEVTGVRKIVNNDQNPEGKNVGPISEALTWFESDRETHVTAVRGAKAGKEARLELKAFHDKLLAKYGFTRQTWMYWDFDIHLDVRPVQAPDGRGADNRVFDDVSTARGWFTIDVVPRDDRAARFFALPPSATL